MYVLNPAPLFLPEMEQYCWENCSVLSIGVILVFRTMGVPISWFLMEIS